MKRYQNVFAIVSGLLLLTVTEHAWSNSPEQLLRAMDEGRLSTLRRTLDRERSPKPETWAVIINTGRFYIRTASAEPIGMLTGVDADTQQFSNTPLVHPLRIYALDAYLKNWSISFRDEAARRAFRWNLPKQTSLYEWVLRLHDDTMTYTRERSKGLDDEDLSIEGIFGEVAKRARPNDRLLVYLTGDGSSYLKSRQQDFAAYFHTPSAGEYGEPFLGKRISGYSMAKGLELLPEKMEAVVIIDAEESALFENNHWESTNRILITVSGLTQSPEAFDAYPKAFFGALSNDKLSVRKAHDLAKQRAIRAAKNVAAFRARYQPPRADFIDFDFWTR